MAKRSATGKKQAAVNFELNRADFSAQTKKLEKTLKKFDAKAVPKVTVQALNKTATKARTQVRRKLADVKGIAPQKLLNNLIQVYKANKNRLKARLWIGLKRGVRIDQLNKTAKAKAIGRGGLFTATMPGGHHSGLYARVPPGKRWSRDRSQSSGRRPRTSPPNLPIDNSIRLQPEAKAILAEKSDEQARFFLPREYARLLKLELQKLSAKAR